MKNKILTQNSLKEVLNYDGDSGVFTWKIKPSRSIKVGSIAGCYSSSDGYPRIRVFGDLYLSHRLAWLYIYGFLPKENIDHKNNKKDDFRIENLRIASQQENMLNVSKYKNNSSGHKGVSWSASRGKWICQASVNGIYKNLGGFETIEQAADAYKIFALHNHGEFCHETVLN